MIFELALFIIIMYPLQSMVNMTDEEFLNETAKIFDREKILAEVYERAQYKGLADGRRVFYLRLLLRCFELDGEQASENHNWKLAREHEPKLSTDEVAKFLGDGFTSKSQDFQRAFMDLLRKDGFIKEE